MKALSLFNLNLEAFQLPCAGLSWEGVWLVQMLLPFLYPACCILHFVISYASGPVSDSARAAHSPHASYSSPLAPLPATGICSRSWRAATPADALPHVARLAAARRLHVLIALGRVRPPMFFFMNMYFYTGVQVMGRHCHHPTSSTPHLLRHLPRAALVRDDPLQLRRRDAVLDHATRPK